LTINYLSKINFKYLNNYFLIMGLHSNLEMKKNNLKIKIEDLLLLVLFMLEKRSFKSISESELQNIIYFLKDKLFSYQFYSKPIIYSYELLEDVQKTNQDGFIESTIEIIGDESVPKYHYSLSLLGKARSQNIIDSLSQETKDKINEYLDEAMIKINK